VGNDDWCHLETFWGGRVPVEPGKVEIIV
jgi:hypothetical protein